VKAATTVAVGIIVIGILLHVLNANFSNGLVSAINDAAKWLVQPFHDAFHMRKPKTTIAVNWGLAAAVYLIAGSFIARMLSRVSFGGARRVRAA
jgi:multisubunit Na+/H+ antiporter MnhG subunit